MSDDEKPDRKLERRQRRQLTADIDSRIRSAVANQPRQERGERSKKVAFFDSTVGITAHNIVAAFSRGPQPFERIHFLVRQYFGQGVAVEPEQMLAVMELLRTKEVVVQSERGLERRKLMARTDDGWDVTDERRRIIRRSVRPLDSDPESGWDGLQLVPVKAARRDPGEPV